MSQFEMFAAAPVRRKPEMPTAETVRPKLDSVLQQLKEGRASEWSEIEQRRWRVVFPQMCEWLPEEEREGKRAEFRQLISSLTSEVHASRDRGRSKRELAIE